MGRMGQFLPTCLRWGAMEFHFLARWQRSNGAAIFLFFAALISTDVAAHGGGLNADGVAIS